MLEVIFSSYEVQMLAFKHQPLPSKALECSRARVDAQRDAVGVLLLQYVLVQLLLHTVGRCELVLKRIAEGVCGHGLKVSGVLASSRGGVAALAHA